MNWKCSNSIKLTRIMIIIFFIALIIMDCGTVYLANLIYDNVYSLNREIATVGLIVGVFYVCSIPAYVTLYFLYKVVIHIKSGEIFTKNNISALRVVSWCCIFVAIICLLAGVTVWYALLVVSVAAGFMALIVRVVKNILEQAMEMKDELEFTI